MTHDRSTFRVRLVADGPLALPLKDTRGEERELGFPEMPTDGLIEENVLNAFATAMDLVLINGRAPFSRKILDPQNLLQVRRFVKITPDFIRFEAGFIVTKDVYIAAERGVRVPTEFNRIDDWKCVCEISFDTSYVGVRQGYLMNVLSQLGGIVGIGIMTPHVMGTFGRFTYRML